MSAHSAVATAYYIWHGLHTPNVNVFQVAVIFNPAGYFEQHNALESEALMRCLFILRNTKPLMHEMAVADVDGLAGQCETRKSC